MEADNSNESSSDENKKQLKINCPEDVATGAYSNLFITNISKEEFIIDFAMLYPHSNQATVQSRVVLTHGNAKKLHELLGKHISEFDQETGNDLDDPSQGIRFSIN